MTLDNARTGLVVTGANSWERRIVAVLEEHGAEEGRLLGAYQHFVDDAEQPAVRYLVNLILEDERRHHQAMVEIANSVAWGDPRLSPEGGVPELPSSLHDEALLAATKSLLDAERRDHRDLEALRVELDTVADTTLWALLVDLMILDTEKHIRILERVADMAEGR